VAGPRTEVGATLPEVSHRLTMEEMILFEPEDESNIHTDDEMAREAGLPAAIAAGTQFMSYIFSMLYQEYGFESVRGTVVDVRIRLPVFAGNTITAKGRITKSRPQDEGLRLALDVWCENQSGQQVIAGAAEVTVPGGAK
jgi:acyl dehydratase